MLGPPHFLRDITGVGQPREIVDEPTSGASTTAYASQEVIRCVQKEVALCLRTSSGEADGGHDHEMARVRISSHTIPSGEHSQARTAERGLNSEGLPFLLEKYRQ